MKSTLIFLLLYFICCDLYTANYDSLFIEKTKAFAYIEFGASLKRILFEKFAESNKPKNIIYTSFPDMIERPGDTDLVDLFKGIDEDKIIEIENIYQKRGYQTFVYKSYANASCFLNERFLSYSNESISFIIFHELLHNYFMEYAFKIPYEFNEAACDVIGNYCSLHYARHTNKIEKDKVKTMIEINEKTYEILNFYIIQISQNPENSEELCDQCNSEMYLLKNSFDKFQTDRFCYTVNTAFLLKNSNYCVKYFLLKKVLQRVKKIERFLEILKGMPANFKDGEKYLQQYLTRG